MSETGEIVTKWVPINNPHLQRRMGKLLEELGELTAVAARIGIQGFYEVDPSSGEVNKDRLQKEIADVLAQCECCIRELPLDRSFVDRRTNLKIKAMAVWEHLSDA